MKRVLVLGMTEMPGGIESVIMNYYRNIDKGKLQMDFLCNTPNIAYEKEIRNLGGEIYKIKSRSKNLFAYYKQLNEFFKNNAKKYSTIWVNICSLANIDYLIFAKKYKIKYRIIHCHNSQNMDSKLRLILHQFNKLRLEKYATDYWTCSQESNEWFFTSKLNKKVVLVHNAIDYDKYKFDMNVREEYREKLNLEGKLVFGNIGRFHFQKNQLRLLEIFKKISERKENTVLLLIGDGEEKNKIEDKIKELKLEDNVKLLGIRDDVEKILQCMDAIIFPSLFEGLPLVLVEAQANGLPIFASDTITKEIVIGDNVTQISLEKNNEYWAKIILNSKFGRCDNYERIQEEGYDIKKESKKIERLLLRE